jgi:SSS family solute:Na+ symporter
VIAALSIFYTLLGVCLFVPVVAGLYVRRVGRLEALGAIAAGVTVVAALDLYRRVTGSALTGTLPPALFGLLASVVACALVAVGRAAYHRGPEAP